MNAARILETFKSQGISVRREGDMLKLKPATGSVPGDLIELARQHKPELMAALQDAAEIGRQRTRLIAAAVAQGIPRTIIAALADADVQGCQWLDEPGLRRYAAICRENHLRARGVAILRPVAQPATRQPPRAAITCASCQHQQPRPDTSTPGMHACAKGHPLHYALEPHVCADWKPCNTPARPVTPPEPSTGASP